MGSLMEAAQDVYSRRNALREGAVPQEPMHSVAKDEADKDEQGEQDLGARIDTNRGKATSGPATAEKGVKGRATPRPADRVKDEEPMHSIPDPDEDSEGPEKFPKRPADANSKQWPMQSLPDNFTTKGNGPKNVDESEVNELSKKTLASYIGKVAANKENGGRIRGMTTAIKKVSGNAKVNATNEEEKDIEANDAKVMSQVKYESVKKSVDEDTFNAADYINVDEDMEALFNGEQLSEEFKEKAATIYEAAITAKVNAIHVQLTEAFEEVLSEEIESIQQTIATNVDEHLNYVIEQWMSDNEVALEAGLRTELTEDFISGLRNLFLENYIDVPDEEVSILGELADKVQSLEDRLNEEIENNVQLVSALNETTKEATFVSLTRNLTEVEADKLRQLAENVKFINEDDFANKLETLYENYYPTESGNAPRLDEQGSTDAEVLAEDIISAQKGSTSMDRYVKALSKTSIK